MTAHWTKKNCLLGVVLYIISSSLSHLISKTLHQKLYFLKCFFSTEQQHSFGEKSIKISQGVQKNFPLFLALFNIFVTDMGKRDGLDNKHIVDDKLYSTNHLNSTKVSWYFQKILSLAQVVKYSTYLHISSKNDRNDIVNCDNCPPTFNKNNHQVP